MFRRSTRDGWIRDDFGRHGARRCATSETGGPDQDAEVIRIRRSQWQGRVGTHHRNTSLRKPLERALKAAGIRDRFTLHGFRRTWNNILRQVASGAITRSMIGHETEEMFLHSSHIEREGKHGAVDLALALVDGAKVEHRVKGPQTGDDARDVSRRETTRND